jgi:hypothetical protein
MKNKLIALFFICLGTFGFANGQPTKNTKSYGRFSASPLKITPKHPTYFYIDNYATAVPPAMTKDVKTLATYLTAPFYFQEHKVRAIYYWVTHHISYDYSKYMANQNNGNASESNPESILALRKGICGDYSDLFAALCRASGIACFSISGWAKQAQGIAPHGWNVVQIDQQWRFVEATWGSGAVDDETGTFYPQFQEDCFLTPPQEFIKQHYPSDPLWQLSTSPISYKDFLAGNTNLSSEKLFDYKQTLQNWIQSSTREQLEGNIQRVNQFAGADSQDEFLRITKYNLGVAYYNEAVTKYNKGVFLFNKYVNYNNERLMITFIFRKRKSLEMIEAAEDQIVAAMDMFLHPIFQDACCKGMNQLQEEGEKILSRIGSEKSNYGSSLKNRQ